ncbi:unnamed protein product [Closterium sp. Yama58-4]|nr:unnamed protein product [Closterium sp. Yama58-4]
MPPFFLHLSSRTQHVRSLASLPLLAEAKEQIVANLANFAYDPINYDYMRKLNVLGLFLDCLTEENAKLVDFGMGGLCNSAADTANASAIASADNIPLIVDCLSSPVESTVLSALACLYYICTPRTRSCMYVCMYANAKPSMHQYK